jgi:hypothetical protein
MLAHSGVATRLPAQNLESRTGIRIRRLAWLVRVDGR